MIVYLAGVIAKVADVIATSVLADDIAMVVDHNGRLNTSVYRKVTHTDQYLHWDSHHAISSKYSVVGTLFHRARTVCSTPGGLQKGNETPTSIPKKMQLPRLGHQQG